MITIKVMPLESTRMESVTFAPLALLLQILSEHNIHFFSPFNSNFFVSITEKREDPKTKSNSVGSNGTFSLTASCHFKPNNSNGSNVSKTNSKVKVVVTSDATKCHSILSVELIREKTNEDEGTYQCRTAGKRESKLASLHAKEGKFLKS